MEDLCLLYVITKTHKVAQANQIKNQAAIVRGQKDTDKSDLKVVDAGPGMQRGERRKK